MWSCLVAGIFPHWAILLALFHYSFDTFIHFDDGICCFLPCFPLSSSSLSYRNPYSQQVPSTPSCHHVFFCSVTLWAWAWAGPQWPLPDEILLDPILCRPPPLTVSSWVRRLRYVPQMSFRCIPLHPLAPILSLPLLEQHSLPRGGSDTAVPFRAERSTITDSQHFFQLWVSALTAAHRNKKLLWRKVRLALICGYKHVCGESIWQCDHLAKMW